MFLIEIEVGWDSTYVNRDRKSYRKKERKKEREERERVVNICSVR